MITESPLPAEAALADLAEQFEDWRRSRAMGQERIPPSLWDRAVALSTLLPCSRVARCLRVRSTDLRKRALVEPAPVTTGRNRADPGVRRSARAVARAGDARHHPDCSRTHSRLVRTRLRDGKRIRRTGTKRAYPGAASRPQSMGKVSAFPRQAPLKSHRSAIWILTGSGNPQRSNPPRSPLLKGGTQRL